MTRLWLIGGGVFLGVLLIASVVLTFTQKEDLPPIGSPEAAVQNFLKAAQEDEYEVTYDFLSAELKLDCDLEDFVGQRRSVVDGMNVNDSRVTLQKTTTAGGVTFVDVKITQFYRTGPFGSSESSYQQRYSLQQENDLWKFSNYPWPYRHCGRNRPVPPSPPPPPRPSPAPTATAPIEEPTAKPAAP